MDKKTTIGVVVILLIYFAFTSGFIFEMTKCKDVETLVTPYSITLSNYRIGLIGVNNNDDIACAKWLVEETDPTTIIHTDYFGTSLIMDLSNTGRHTYIEPEGYHYLFLTSWSTENQEMVQGWFEGRRSYESLPDLSNAREAHREGNAVVYEMNY